MENWDIMNSRGELTGRQTVRSGNALSGGEYHLVVHIWVVSPEGKLLIQRRSRRKKFMPGEWAATGGAVIAGETSLSAARRELKEELGIEAAEEEFKFVTRFKRKSSFIDLWAVESNLPVHKLRLQRSEVSAARWISAKELREMLTNGSYHNYGAEYFAEVFSLADKGIKNVR